MSSYYTSQEPQFISEELKFYTVKRNKENSEYVLQEYLSEFAIVNTDI